jgi:hypothetical protein
MNKKRAVEIVKKCLALAENNTSMGEAVASMLKAQELMFKYDISADDLAEKEEKKIVHSVISDWGRTELWKKALASVVASNFRCFMYTHTTHGGTTIMLVGLEGDVELAKGVFEFAVSRIEQHMKALKQSRGSRNDYIFGFIEGLRDKFAEQKSNDKSIVISYDEAVIKEVERMRLKYTRSNGVASNNDKEAREKGVQDGRLI